jgi:hypothetical protein
LHYLKRAFPLRRQLVGSLPELDPAKNKVTFLKLPGKDVAAMIAAQTLLITRCAYSCPGMDFLKQIDIIMPSLLLISFIISLDPRRPVCEFRGEYRFCSIDKSEGGFSCCSIWHHMERPTHNRNLISPESLAFL